MSLLLPPAVSRQRLVRQSTLLFNWSGDDGQVRSCRSGQTGTFTRAAGTTVITSTATSPVGVGQPRWKSTTQGAAAEMQPTSDNWSFAWNAALQALTVYVEVVVPTLSSSGTQRLIALGDGSANSVLLSLAWTTGGYGNTTGQYVDGSTNPSVTLTASGNPVPGDHVEYLLQLDTNRKVTVARSVSGGAQQTSSLSSAGAAFSGSFHNAVLKLADGSNSVGAAYRNVRVAAGVLTLAQMQGQAR